MSRACRSMVDSSRPGSVSRLSIMMSASCPRALHTSTHSAQPLQWTASTKIPNAPRSSPRLAGTSPYLVVGAKCSRAVLAATSGCGCVAANVSIRDSSSGSGTTIPKIALSGQALTQAMHPTHLSRRNSGMRGASRLKSRVAEVPGGMMLRARPASAGSSTSAMPRR